MTFWKRNSEVYWQVIAWGIVLDIDWDFTMAWFPLAANSTKALINMHNDNACTVS